MAALRFCRLPASSLVEVTVASVILVLVFGLALGSLARLSVSGPSQLALRGRSSWAGPRPKPFGSTNGSPARGAKALLTCSKKSAPFRMRPTWLTCALPQRCAAPKSPTCNNSFMRRRLLRLEAFTILELLVVLVVSALLFSMAYGALRAVQRQQGAIERKSSLLSQVSTWQAVLDADFAAGTVAKVANDQVRCFGPKGEVRYTYSYADSALVREQGELTDTFALPIRQCTFLWQGAPRATGLIDEMTVLGITAQDTFYLQARLRYAAQQLLFPPSPLLP